MGRGYVFPVWFSFSFTAMWVAMVLLSPPSGMVAALIQIPISHTAQGFLPRHIKENRMSIPQVEEKGDCNGRAGVRPSCCLSANRAPSCAETAIASSERQVPTGSDPLHHNRSPFGRLLP